MALTVSAPLASTVTSSSIDALTVGLTTDAPMAPATRTVPPCCCEEESCAVPPWPPGLLVWDDAVELAELAWLPAVGDCNELLPEDC